MVARSNSDWDFRWVVTVVQQIFVFFVFFFGFWIDCDDALNRSVFAMIPNMTWDNQNKT